MEQASQHDAVLRLVDEFIELSKSGPIEKISLSEKMLLSARIHYRQARPGRALVYLARAVVTRPIIVGRPLKRPAKSLLAKSRAATNRA